MKYPVGGNDDFKRAPAGTHVGVCNMIADVGIQPGGMYGPKQKVYFRFELPNERIEYTKDGVQKEGPQTIGTFHTASMNKKALMRAMLENWRGRKFTDDEAADFNIRNVLGRACLINVVEDTKDGKTYSNIANVMPLPKGTPAPVAENPLLYYGVDDESKRDSLPEWLRKKIDAQLPMPTQHSVEDRLADSQGDPDDEHPVLMRYSIAPIQDESERKEAHDRAFYRHYLAVYWIKQWLREGKIKKAVEEWALIPGNDQNALWVAPSKGGCLNTTERLQIREGVGKRAFDLAYHASP